MRISRRDAKAMGISEDQLPPAKRSKYRNVRTEYNGRTYASKAEANWAARLDLAGDRWWWLPQVAFELGDERYVVDFLVFGRWREGGRNFWDVVAHDVKGFETPKFEKIRKLWAKYGPCPLVVVKRQGKNWTTEIIEGKP